jgi:hypothetical protein
MFSSKKGQGLSLNTIIIAILVLIVLVVIVLIFTGYFSRIFAPGVQSCTAKGGVCQALGADSATQCKDSTQGGSDRVLSTFTVDADAVKAGCKDVSEVCCRKNSDIATGSPV